VIAAWSESRGGGGPKLPAIARALALFCGQAPATGKSDDRWLASAPPGRASPPVEPPITVDGRLLAFDGWIDEAPDSPAGAGDTRRYARSLVRYGDRAECRLVGHFRQPPAAAAIHQGRRQGAGRQATQGCPQARVARGSDFQHPRARRAHGDGAGDAFAYHPQRQQSGDALLQQQAVARRGQAGLEHGMRGAHARVPGERHLAARAEDPQPVAGAARHRRQHEGRFGQPCPARDRLHGVVPQAFGVQHHRQWIAGAGAIGEDVELQVAAACGHRDALRGGFATGVAG